MPNNDEKQCLECGWVGDIEECPREKQWADHAGGYYISVAICPKCSSDHLAAYDSQEAKDSRLQFTGEEQVENKLAIRQVVQNMMFENASARVYGRQDNQR